MAAGWLRMASRSWNSRCPIEYGSPLGRSWERAKWEFYGNRKKQIVKVVFDWEGDFVEEAGGDVRFVLGKHPIAETIGRLLISGEVVRTSIGHNVSGILRKPVPIENQ